jgi:hypothetical protein
MNLESGEKLRWAKGTGAANELPMPSWKMTIAEEDARALLGDMADTYKISRAKRMILKRRA